MNVPNPTSIKQNPFRQSGLSRVDMRRNTNVPLKVQPLDILFRKVVFNRFLFSCGFRLCRFGSSCCRSQTCAGEGERRESRWTCAWRNEKTRGKPRKGEHCRTQQSRGRWRCPERSVLQRRDVAPKFMMA